MLHCDGLGILKITTTPTLAESSTVERWTKVERDKGYV